MPDERATSSGRKWALRVGMVFFWLVLVLEVLTMGEAGLGKFESLDGWKHWFTVFGYPAWMAPVVGVVEVSMAALLLVPGLAAYAAIVLMVVMTGALESVLTNETDLGWFDPTLHLVFLTLILGVRWKRRWRRRRKGDSTPA